MLKCEIRADNTLHIEGYVNAVERDSKPVMVPSLGRCVEQVRAGVFGAALAENPDVELLENHDHSRKLGSTSDGVLTLSEDSIGLRASADISDPDMITKARTGQLKGWSFGFVATSSEVENRANGIPRRTVTGMKLSEVSLIDGKYTPCYAGTLVEVRAVDDSAEMVEFRADEDIEIIDTSSGDEELRYNPYHDPSNGRFCSGGGSGGGGVLMVEKGQKGKGVYVVENSKFDNFDNKEAENISAAESEEFKKNIASLRKSSVKLPEHYAESLKAGDLTHEEYNELMTDLPKNVTENQKFIAKDRFGSHVIAGTTFEQDGEKFGVFSTGKDNEFVVDFNNGKTLPIKSTDLDGNTLFSYSSKVSQTVKSLKNIRGITNRRSFDPDEITPEELRSLADEEIETDNNSPAPDYSYYERAMKLLELRYNPYHDPSNGRFCSGGGSGGGGVLMVEKGQKGKGVYVVPNEKFQNNADNDMYEMAKYSAAKSGAVYLEYTESDGETKRYAATDRPFSRNWADVDSIPPNAGGVYRKSFSQKQIDYINMDTDALESMEKEQKQIVNNALWATNMKVSDSKMASKFKSMLDAETELNYISTALAFKKGKTKVFTRAFSPNESEPEEQRSLADEVIEDMDNSPENEVSAPDYSYYERAMKLLELRYNPYHDPSNGRFCSGGGGGGGGVLFVGKGQKGKGVYVVDVDHDDEYEQWKAAKSGGGISEADKAIREATGGVIQKDEYTEINVTAYKKNKKASTTYDKTVLTADVDSNGNIKLDYAKGEYDGNYGDPVQNVKYKIKAGFVDDTPVNLDLSKASTLKGNTYGIKKVAKEAGMVWNPRSDSWVKKDHPINAKTRYSSSELSAMSDSDLNRVYNAVFYNVGIYKGNSFKQLDSAVSRNEGVARDKKISTIIKYNSMKEFGGG